MTVYENLQTLIQHPTYTIKPYSTRNKTGFMFSIKFNPEFGFFEWIDETGKPLVGYDLWRGHKRVIMSEKTLNTKCDLITD